MSEKLVTGAGGAGFALICLSYMVSSATVATKPGLAAGAALLIAGYGLLSYNSWVDWAESEEGAKLPPWASHGEVERERENSEKSERVAHALLALFFWLSYVLPLTLEVQSYDALGAAGHALFLMSSFGVVLPKTSPVPSAMLAAYYIVSGLHAAGNGTAVAHVQVAGRALAACYYMSSVRKLIKD
jgi:hypothetical protein